MSIVDESVYLGAALMVAPQAAEKEKSDERVDAIVTKRKSVHAVLGPAADTLLEILDETIKKESDVNTVHQRAGARAKRESISTREALTDEMLYSTGRLDMANTLKQLITTAKKETRIRND